MRDWRRVSLNTIAEIYDGPHATPTKLAHGPWYLNIASLQSGRLRLEESAHISEDSFALWTRRVRPCPGDVLFSYETRLGEAAAMPDHVTACLGRRMGLLRPRRSEVEPRFLLYAYLGPLFQETIRQRTVHGATVERLPISEMGKWEIEVPPLSEQRAIAEVLGALDDKIEANNTLIAAAGRLGAALFHATFERHTDNVKVRLGDIADVIDCLHSKKPDRDHSQFRYLVLPDIRDDGRLEVRPNFTISERDYVTWTRRIEVGAGDCVITNVGRVGAAAQLPKGTKAAIGRNMTAVRARANQYEAFLIEALCSKSVAREITDKTDQGTILSALNVRSIPQLNLPAGAGGEYETFQRRCEPLHDLEDALLAESERLSEVRDALLPRLLSGELLVREAEAIVEDAV